MKIFFTAANDVNKEIKITYKKIIAALSINNQVDEAIFSKYSNKELKPNDQKLAEDIHSFVLNKINKSDTFIAEITSASAGLGYQIYHAFYQKKPIILFYRKGFDSSVILRGIKSNKVVRFSYTDLDDLLEKLPIYLTKANKMVKVRFNLVINNKEMSFVNDRAGRMGISNTQYIRGLIKDASSKS